MNNETWDWELYDNDCCQYMRKTGPRTYEMIQCVWLDTTKEDIAEGLHEYAVVTGYVNLEDMPYEEMLGSISVYGYSEADYLGWEADVRDSMVAECNLEEDLLSDEYVIAAFNSFDETKAFVEDYVAMHPLPAILYQ